MNSHSFTEIIKTVINKAVPDVKVISVQPIPSNRLQRVYSVTATDGRLLMLTLSPPQTLRLLRSELYLVPTNFIVTKFLLNAKTIGDGRVSRTESTDGRVSPAESTDTVRTANQPEKEKQPARARVLCVPQTFVLPPIPRVISFSPWAVELGSSFNLFEPTEGIPLAHFPEPPTTAAERESIDFQVGRLVRGLAEATSPNGMFGPAAAVVAPNTVSLQPPTLSTAPSSRSWANAFHSLLEAILRDGEDMAVTISYHAIRSYLDRFSHVLDAVKVPRLVVPDASDDTNLLVSRAPAHTKENPYSRSEQEYSSEESTAPPPTGVHDLVENEEQPTASGKQTTSDDATSARKPSNIAVTGIWDWGSAVYGDPLFATAFNQEASSEFLRGFRLSPRADRSPRSRKTLKRSRDEDNPQEDDSDKDDENDIIEDRDNASIRLLLYECYHATVGVVTQFYRPGPDSNTKELAARRRLAAALVALNEVGEAVVGKRPRRVSGDTWPPWPPMKKRKRDDGSSADAHGKL
ncbi:hypothetical protein DL764_007328 [Monosporascus ibericus]|uniref:Aminoglycoside phosphotransferase domain-containing protein n=1 Tax=Monosporascus ibericus TaxID=155417 RepID=A0A4Q4T4Y0_9PEZI|nr:hypothetical protein DL764_007328 [Monosporascus ibericus]